MQARRTEAETFRTMPAGRRILVADAFASTLSNPACCPRAAWATPSTGGPREWRSPCSDRLVCACSSADVIASFARSIMHDQDSCLSLR